MSRIILLLIVFSAPVFAKKTLYQCANDGNIQTCNTWLGIRDSVTAKTAPDPQQQANWCWLASIEMAFQYYGYTVPQATILDLLWGRIEDMPGNSDQIIAATNRVYTDNSGKRFRSESRQAVSWFDASAALSADVPVLLAYAQAGGVGHMTMLAGMQMQFLYDAFGNVIDSRVTDIVVWDPWPGVGLRQLTPTEFANVFTLVAVKTTALDPTLARSPPPKAVQIPLRSRFDLLGRPTRP